MGRDVRVEVIFRFEFFPVVAHEALQGAGIASGGRIILFRRQRRAVFLDHLIDQVQILQFDVIVRRRSHGHDAEILVRLILLIDRGGQNLRKLFFGQNVAGRSGALILLLLFVGVGLRIVGQTLFEVLVDVFMHGTVMSGPIRFMLRLVFAGFNRTFERRLLRLEIGE